MNRKEFTHAGGTHLFIYIYILIFIHIYLYTQYIYIHIHVQSEEVCHCYVPSLGEYDVPVLI